MACADGHIVEMQVRDEIANPPGMEFGAKVSMVACRAADKDD